MKKFFIFFLLFNSFQISFSQNPQWITYTSNNSGLPNSYLGLNCLAIDKNNNIWIGTSGKGLVRFDGDKWIVYNSSNSGISWDYATCLGIDKQNNIWIGYNGITKFDGSNWLIYKPANSDIPKDGYHCLVPDSSGNIWLGTGYNTQDGWGWNYYGDFDLIKFDGLNWNLYNSVNSDIKDYIVLNVAIDKEDNKWISTWGGGLIKYYGNNWTTYNMSNSKIPDDYIRCVAIDKNNIKWVGTWSGLAKFNDTTWTKFDVTNTPLPENDIKCITIDNKGNKWLATYDFGIAKYNDTVWTIYNSLNSMIPSDYINSIISDKNGNIWLTTNNTLTELIEKGNNDNVDEILSDKIKMKCEIYPNPANQQSTFIYKLPERSYVKIMVYDILGKVIATLVNQEQEKGKQTFLLDTKNLKGGLYYYRVVTGKNDFTGKLVVVH